MPDLHRELFPSFSSHWVSLLCEAARFWVRLLTHALKVLAFLFQWIRKRFLTSIFSVSPLQHLEEWFRVLRQFSIKSFHPERISSVDRKPFALLSYLFLRSIDLSHL